MKITLKIIGIILATCFWVPAVQAGALTSFPSKGNKHKITQYSKPADISSKPVSRTGFSVLSAKNTQSAANKLWSNPQFVTLNPGAAYPDQTNSVENAKKLYCKGKSSKTIFAVVRRYDIGKLCYRDFAMMRCASQQKAVERDGSSERTPTPKPTPIHDGADPKPTF